LSHGVTISYADSFSDDNNSRNTLAYPTTVTDAGGFSSSTKYNYDFGAATRKQTPLPNVTDNEAGPVQTIEYDSLGRLQKVKNLFNNAYTRYEYPASQNRVDTYVTIVDTSTEAHSFKITDGHGRVIASAADHPGSTGGFSGRLIIYDIMARAVKTSNPTETSATSSSGNPYDWPTAGDDAQAGWIYTQQSYDWKGRPLVTTNPSITSNPNDTTTKTASYAGCGCAGGAVVVTRDEVGRRQKTTFDPLGRLKKTEILYEQSKSTALDGSGEVYSTTENTLDTLDQVTQVTQTDNATSAYQVTTMGYDGYGRLHTKHLPEQQVDSNNSSSTDHTTYAYNDDDTISSVTDARGASATYTYYSRHLVHTITYSSPSGSEIAVPGTVSFDYDAAGNRTSMSDATGSCTYAYDTLSRMTSETRSFTGLSGSYTLSYAYNLGGELTSITDPFSVQVGYSYDGTGRLLSVNNSGATSFQSQYLSNISYRAWGALKDRDYGNGAHQHVDYNTRLLPTAAALSNVSKTSPYTGTSATYSWTYDYYDDGRVHHAYDADDNKWDRSYTYDHAARLSEADTNKRARGETPDDYWHPDPYHEIFTYDVWGHQDFVNVSATYTNNRRSGWSYDADGNTTVDGSYNKTFDGAGQYTNATALHMVGDGDQYPEQPEIEITQSYDGNGQSLKRNQITRRNQYDLETEAINGVNEVNQTTYNLRSSVLGGAIVDEIGQDWQNNVVKMEGYVYAGGERIAKQSSGQYEHHNPVTNSWVTMWASSHQVNREERDAVGGQLPLTPPPSGSSYASLNFGAPLFIDGGDPFATVPGVTMDGLPMSQSELQHLVSKEGTGMGFSYYFTMEWHTDGDGLKNVSIRDGWTFLELPEPASQKTKKKDPNQQIIDDAVADAASILSTDNPCSRFFNASWPANGSRDGTEVLKELATRLKPALIPNDKTIGIKQSDFTDARNNSTGLEYRVPGSAIVNLNGPFFRGGSFGSFGSTSRAGRALAILHELAHDIKAGTERIWTKKGVRDSDVWRIPDDGGNDELSRQNTDDVEAACKNELKALQ
jgi:YD repeat-containing protein